MDSLSGLKEERGHLLGTHLLDVFASASLGGLMVDQDLRIVASRGNCTALVGAPALDAGTPLPGPLRDICAQVVASGVSVVDLAVPEAGERSSSPGRVQLTVMPLFNGIGPPSGALLLAREIPNGPSVPDEGRTRESRLATALSAAGAAPFTYTATSQMAVLGPRPWDCSSDIPTNVEITLDDLIAAAHPDDKPRLRAAFTNPPQGRDINCPYRVVQPNGSVHWYTMRARAAYGADGQHEETVGAFLDMDEDRRQTQAAEAAATVSMECEARIALALKAARATTFRYDPANRTLHYEDDVLRVYNLPAGQPVPFATILEHLAPEDHQRLTAAFAKLDRGESTTLYLNYQIAHPTLGQRLCTIVGDVVMGTAQTPPYLSG